MFRSPTLDVACRLGSALDAVAAALASADVTALVKAEEGLAGAVANMGGANAVELGERTALFVELARARAALARCRILGAAAVDAVQATLVVQGRSGDYDRSAMPARVGVRGAVVKARL
ncbi:MAG: hypothetical protein A3J29_18990 [Acidobacteria bacterium RIFCSPLOWO2_12_FULL_67_14b]|nr:MAG: hypothetical protein A3J29_18990 [Acidobacteria bacterium RIFCSPLOWO2_12_FULL_67_14b]